MSNRKPLVCTLIIIVAFFIVAIGYFALNSSDGNAQILTKEESKADISLMAKKHYPKQAKLVSSELDYEYVESPETDEPILAVFVIDASGSMSGDVFSKVRTDLIDSMKYIGSNNYVGIVSYADFITINLPIARFDEQQQSYFKGALETIRPAGGTATFNGLVVAADMINKETDKHPDAHPVIFLISDGVTNRGRFISEVSAQLEALEYPICVIGYNADISQLEEISGINETETINADSEDVSRQLEIIFSAEM